ncbi:subtilisin-like protein [Trichoderma longibrachiatum ATCC 18648]|uniref:Subtilisin-like protein n=1 Tax=Trichoderma longibrachiatum ATCC 18648 TaxID=983965 RepID=A0A2T4C1T9_TRILO|nr:subtilisin-like protein [Trichoderma longibrachiatum ATCC 18648]
MVRSALFVSLLATFSGVIARGSGHGSKVVPGAYIFEFEVSQDTADFYKKLNGEGSTRLKFDYKLFKGVSVQLKDLDNHEAKAQQMAELPAVKNVWPVTLIDAPNPKVEWVAGSTAPTLESRSAKKPPIPNDSSDFPTHQMTQIDKLRAKGYTGKGVRVAVIDTGIDYTHPALGGCFGRGCLVSFGTDLVGDDYTGFNTPVPDDDPVDCAGHGSHVAGIIAAQKNPYGFTGGAPEVTLGAYRVFGCDGQAGNDVLISAYNQAFEDGAQIITASIGGPSGWAEEPWAAAVTRIVEAGVPCTVSAGNEGDSGLFFASTAANGKKVIAVASVDNENIPSVLSVAAYKIDSGAAQDFGYVSSSKAWDGVSKPLYAVSFDTTIPDDGCSALPDSTPDLSDYIVLVRRGTCTFVQKAQNVAAKGAKYLLYYNNIAGALAVDVSAVPEIEAVGMVDDKTGATWIAALKAGKTVTLTLTDPVESEKQIQFADNPTTGGALSGFTTWGPTWELDVKPQISSPGGNILSTYPVALGGYATLSGTSMACPLTAAAVALIGQARGTFDPALIENLLATTANPQLFNDGEKFYDFLAPVPQQGGGLIQAYDAAFATTLLSPSSLSFNDTDHFVKKRQITLKNTSKQRVTYKLNHVPTNTFYTLAPGNGYPAPFPNDAVAAHANLQFGLQQVTLPAGRSITVDVFPSPPKGVDARRLALWSGYITVNGTDGTSLSVPYQGLTGSLHKQKVLYPEDSWIADSTDESLAPVENGTVFTIPAPGNAGPDDKLPSLVVSPALGSRYVRVDLVLLSAPPHGTKLKTVKFLDTTSIGQPAGSPLLWISRGANPLAWNGELSDNKFAPPGTYKAVFHALRIFGNEKKKEDWDVSESPAFTIKYA